MFSLRRVGPDSHEGRALFLLNVQGPEDLPKTLDLPSPYFACLVAWDATTANESVMRAVAEKLVFAGCVYACCWGPGCERLHDMIDLVDLERDLSADRVVMTTWHGREALSEALWFLLNLAHPDPGYETGCRSSVAISVGSERWATEIASAIANPGAISGGFDLSERAND